MTSSQPRQSISSYLCIPNRTTRHSVPVHISLPFYFQTIDKPFLLFQYDFGDRPQGSSQLFCLPSLTPSYSQTVVDKTLAKSGNGPRSTKHNPLSCKRASANGIIAKRRVSKRPVKHNGKCRRGRRVIGNQTSSHHAEVGCPGLALRQVRAAIRMRGNG